MLRPTNSTPLLKVNGIMLLKANIISIHECGYRCGREPKRGRDHERSNKKTINNFKKYKTNKNNLHIYYLFHSKYVHQDSNGETT